MVIGPDDAMCRAGRTFELGLGKNKVLRNPSVSRAAGRKAGQGQSAPAGICAAAKEGVGWVERGGDEMGGGEEGLSALRDECPQCVRAVPSVPPCVEVGAAAHSRSACPGGELCPGTRVRPAAVSIVVNADLSECYILFSEAGSAHQ